MRRTGISALAVAAALALPTGPADAAAVSAPAQTARFCGAVSQWGLSQAVKQLQFAVEQRNKKAMTEAFKAWTDETQAMVDALPPRAPKPAKRGFANLNEAIQELAHGRRASKPLLKVYRQSRGPVLSYYRRTCG